LNFGRTKNNYLNFLGVEKVGKSGDLMGTTNEKCNCSFQLLVMNKSYSIKLSIGLDVKLGERPYAIVPFQVQQVPTK
jgi:hypothetical protein